MTTNKQCIYILIAFFVILTIKPLESFAKGREGSYILTGFAISKAGDTLKNQQIIMSFKDVVQTLQTDSDGYYKTKVQWATACSSGKTFWQRRRANKKFNPKYIFFSFKDEKIKVKNDWKKFVSTDFNDPDRLTKRKDLTF